MYALIEEAKENLQGYSLTGTVGSVPFSHKNIIGKLKVSNKASNPSKFNLGNASIGQLTATLHGLNIDRNQWRGLYITPVVTIGETAVPFPSKRYKIDQAEHINGMVKITAYDDMALFEKAASVAPGTAGSVYDFLSLACEECGVELGMTAGETEALTNGIQPLVLEEMGDIETWRDLLYWLGVTTCAFSIINREGKLELRPFHNEVDDILPVNTRYDGATYDDEIVTYTGVYVNVTEAEEVRYYAAETDDGYSLTIGTNPFLQGTEDYRRLLATNIAEGMAGIEYISGNISIPFGFHYDLGDVLQFPGGNGSATNKFCILAYEYTYNDKCKLTGIPGDKKSMSKSDKSIQGLLSNTSRNETTSYEVKNTRPITIGDNETIKIVSVRMASNKTTKAMIHIEVNLEASANEPQTEYEIEDNIIHLADIWQGVTDTATKGIVTYINNSEEDELHPTETWIDGKHVLHLMYILGLQQGIASTFDVYMKSAGGTITIDRGGVWLYALGVGLVGDGKWDGTIRAEDVAVEFDLTNIGFEEATETASITTQVPESITAADTAIEFNIINIIAFESADEILIVGLFAGKFALITETGEAFITEDGIQYVTEND